jgi:nickel-dependent lactate racemase
VHFRLLRPQTPCGQLFRQLLPREAEPAFAGRQWHIEGVSHFGKAQPLEVVHFERQPLVFGNLGQTQFDDLGHLSPLDRRFRGNDIARDPLEDVILLTRIAAHGAEQGVVGLPADVVDEQVPGNPEHPASKPAGRQIIPELVVELEQRFLRQVLGQLGISRAAKEKSPPRPLVALDQFVECGRVSVLQTEHQLVIVVRHESVVWSSHRVSDFDGTRSDEASGYRVAGLCEIALANIVVETGAERASMDPERIELPFGADAVYTASIAGSRLAGRFRPPDPIEDVRAAVEASVASPHEYPPLHQGLVPGDRITVVLDRHTPRAASIIAGIWPEFERREISPADVTILQPADIASQPVSDPRLELPDAVRRDVKWHVHDPLVTSACAYVATTAAGDRIYLSREFVDADASLLVGCVEFDRLWGYRGLQSSLFPGLSTVEALRKSHGQPHDELEIDDPRPLRQQAEEIAWLVGLQFGVAVLPAEKGGVSSVQAGQLEVVFRSAVERLNATWRVSVSRRPELVVVAVDHDDGSRSWDQLAHALHAARNLVVKDGRIAVLSQLSAPLGEGMAFIRNSRKPSEAMKPLREQMPPDLLAATSLARAVERANVYLVSQLEPDLVEELFMVPISNESEFQRLIAGDEPVAVIRSGQHVAAAPIVSRSKGR